MTVETPYRDFLAFWERASELPDAEQQRMWHELYAGRHRALLDYYETSFCAPGALREALGRYGEVAGELEEHFAALDLQGAAAATAELLATPPAPRAIAMAGLFRADAWVDELDGGPVAFFALEMVGPPKSPALIAIHEFGHVAHRLAHGSAWDDTIPGLLLLMEGIAITATRRLRPDAPPDQHFSVEDFAGWEADCEAAWGRTLDALLGCLDTPDALTQRRFFWPDWGREERDVPERIAYLVGTRVVDQLLERCDLGTLARWPAERALAEVRATLRALR